MLKRTYAEYQKILSELGWVKSVLEVGALPSEHSLLNAPELKSVANKVGVNLFNSGEYKDIKILKADARKLPFPDSSFELILCASTLEHIPDFWVACSEMKRVLSPGGVLVISVPGFIEKPVGNKIRHVAKRMGLPDLLQRGTPTMRIHDDPNDYYRFSTYSINDVIMSGLEVKKAWSIMNPPRIYAIGHKV